MSGSDASRWCPAWVNPTLLPYLFVLLAVRLGFSATAAYPFSAITSRTLGGWPQGDAMVFEEGGLMLLEIVRLHRPALWAAAEQAAMLAVLAIPIGVVAEALLLSALASGRGAKLGGIAGRVAEALTPLAILAVLRLLLLAAVGMATYVLWEGLAPASRAMLGVPAGDLVGLVIPLIGLLCALAIGVLYDVARSAAVGNTTDTPHALVQAWSTIAERFWSCVFAYASRTSGALFVVVAGWQMTAMLGEWTAWSAAVVGGVQQLVLLAMLLLRVSWLARARELVDETGGQMVSAR